MLERIKKFASRWRNGAHIVPRGAVRARFDVVQPSDDYRRHWANADSLSAAAALSPGVRQKIRDYSRYEVQQNSYAKGIGLTITNDTIGSGPMLQLLGVDRSRKKEVESRFWEWSQEIQLAEKLRQMRFARYDSGEAFAMFVSNRGLRNRVKLDLRVIESEQIANPVWRHGDRDVESDGIGYDQYGNPVTYRQLRYHPGSQVWMPTPDEFDDIPAGLVFHYYRPDRIGQLRGIPDLLPALVLFAELRRACAAVIAAYETAADHAAIFTTPAPTEENPQRGDELPSAWDLVNLEKRAGLVAPEGYDVKQLKAEQPTSAYDMFETAKIREISRCLCVPLHIATLDARVANMSSSYVIGQMYTQERIVDRSRLDVLLDKLFQMWLEEATLYNGYLPDLPPTVVPQWGWPSLGHHADPQKVANATETMLSIGMTTIPIEYAKHGLDWEEQDELAAKSHSVTVDEYREMRRNKIFGTKPDNGDNTDEKESEGAPSAANGNGRHF